MAQVDPFLLPIPKALQNDPETRNFFEYFVRWAHDMWVRTGGGDDTIEELDLDYTSDLLALTAINQARAQPEIEALQQARTVTNEAIDIAQVMAMIARLEQRVKDLENEI